MAATPGLNLNLDKSQCTGAIDSENNAVLSADFKNVIFKKCQFSHFFAFKFLHQNFCQFSPSSRLQFSSYINNQHLI